MKPAIFTYQTYHPLWHDPYSSRHHQQLEHVLVIILIVLSRCEL